MEQGSDSVEGGAPDISMFLCSRWAGPLGPPPKRLAGDTWLDWVEKVLAQLLWLLLPPRERFPNLLQGGVFLKKSQKRESRFLVGVECCTLNPTQDAPETHFSAVASLTSTKWDFTKIQQSSTRTSAGSVEFRQHLAALVE